MSKNNTLADSAYSLVTSTKDEHFKHIIRYKGIAALLVKLTVREFQDKSLEEIARAIVDDHPHDPKYTKVAIFEDEVDFIPTESGTKDEKNIIHDAVFRMRSNNREYGIALGNVITVNTEMQTTTSTTVLGYNLVSRALYYVASLLRSTVAANDTKYEGIHKVYTIWFCTKNIKFDTTPDERIKEQYIHRLGIRRFYPDIEFKVVGPEPSSDLMEVVLVELSKLKDHIDLNIVEMINTLFYDTSNIVDELESTENISLTKVRKDVYEMKDRATVRAEGVEEGIETGMIQAAKNLMITQMLKGKTFDEPKAIKILNDNLMCGEKIAREAYRLAMIEVNTQSELELSEED